MGDRARTITLRLATVLVGVLVAVLVAEGSLRLIGFSFNLYPTKVEFGWPDPVTIKDIYQPDQDLLWVPKDYDERLGKRSATGPDLVFMGCSCTEFGAYDQFLAAAVDSGPAAGSFSFRNLGVGGWSSYQGLQQLQRDVVPLGPKVVTIYFGWNDHWNTFGYQDKQIAAYNLENLDFLMALSSRSRVFQLINKSLFTQEFAESPAGQRVVLADFRTNLQQMVRVARSNGITPVLLTAPTSHRLGAEPRYLQDRWINNLSDLVPLHDAYVNVVREVAQAENADMVDLYRLFQLLPPAESTASFQSDGIHLTETGSRHTARFLYDYFVINGLLEKLTAPPIAAN